MVTENETTDVSAHIPVACTLTTKQASRQLLEWSELQHHAVRVTAIDGGVRMTFPATIVAEVEDLERREGACCSFLTIATAVESDMLTLEVTTANPDGLAVISMLAGIPLP